jgi:phosphoglycolate phosphatase
LAALLNTGTGAYGDDDPVRANLVNVARERTRVQTGATFTEETTVIIGDSSSDVEAALKGGAQIIAVASGGTSVKELQSAGATAVLRDLADTAAVRRAVAGL